MLPSPRLGLCLLSLLLLVSCSEIARHSDAFSISSPEEKNIDSGSGNGEFIFQVYNLDPNNTQQTAQVWQQAYSAVNGFVSSGSYTVRFFDGKVGDEILVVHYSLTPDLLFQHKIELVSYTYCPRFSQYGGLPHPQTY